MPSLPRLVRVIFDTGYISLTPEGTLKNGKIWAETVGEGDGAQDGMKIDTEGSLIDARRPPVGDY